MLAPTTSLVEALNRFDPLHPLQSEEELRDFYIARAHSPLEPLISYLRVMQKPVKLLFMGHRGSGKSTELAKLASRMHHQFFVVHFYAGEILNLNDVEPVDVVLGCAFALLSAVAEEQIIVKDARLRDLEEWLRNEVLTEQVIVRKSEQGVAFGTSLKGFVTELSAKFNRESTTRKTIRPRLKTMVSELVERINAVIDYTRKHLRPPLVLIEDLDKTGLDEARKIFFEEGQLLRLLDCHVVYTFPIALRYSNDYAQIKHNFQVDFKLPNIKIYNKDGTRDEVGRASLQQLALKRADTTLFGPGALERAVECSGGLVADLVRLLQGATLRAMVAAKAQITPEMVDEVAAEIRSDFRAMLRADHYQALRDAAARHEVINATAVQDALHNLSLLEYRNAEDWCDVHPIVKPLLNSTSV